MRRLLALPLVVALAACGSGAKTSTPPQRLRPPQPPPSRVVVLDGDTKAPVPGARVTVGVRSALTDARGVARLRLPRRAGATIAISAAGYLAAELAVPRPRPAVSSVRIYRRALQWPMYGVDPQRTQSQTEIHLRPPFRIVWSHAMGGLTEFPAVVYEGAAYVANYSGTVQALSMTDGHALWHRRTPNGKMAASPAVWGRLLVVHGMDGQVRLLDRSDGRVVWRFTVGSPIESSPVVRGGIDYFGAWDGVVYALDLHRRRLAWTYRSGCKMTSSASLAGAALYIGDYCGHLLALTRASGAERWAGTVDGRIYGTPAVAGGRVFVPSSSGGSLTAFSTGGSLLWRREIGSYVYSSPAVWGGRVFFGSYAGTFYALSAANGSTLWTVSAGGPISGAAVVVDGVAYAGSFAHRILGVSARTGRILLDFPHGEYVPVSGNGGRLLLYGYSRLYAVEPR